MGYGILDIGAQTRQQGMAGLRDAANRENEVEMGNKQLKAQEKQAKMSAAGAGAATGAMIGASYGSAGGPVGAIIGAGVGFLASSLF
ncbi:bacteriocin [Aeromonas sp. PrichA-15]|uniref:bacteriocin n=1 Tax=Aeromonas sp. PrichA-15 TaxID=2823360 RepID=UPI001B343F18|nr:bacteriocin [Aeromonas sp. PrichA-15]MBP4034342.1 bacteriocin [Aeromonas sp. PrichA-15]